MTGWVEQINGEDSFYVDGRVVVRLQHRLIEPWNYVISIEDQENQFADDWRGARAISDEYLRGIGHAPVQIMPSGA